MCGERLEIEERQELCRVKEESEKGEKIKSTGENWGNTGEKNIE